MPRFAEPVRAPSAKKSASRPAAVRPPARRLAPAQQAALGRLLQLKGGERAAAAPAPKTPSRSSLPDRLKAGVEQLSGLSMDDVRVHRDSPEPARLGALAFTQGSDIHLGPGQEQHLPHEAWHVVQQKQGRVNATAQMKGVAISEDRGLEAEADRIGALAARERQAFGPSGLAARGPGEAGPILQKKGAASRVLQMVNGGGTELQPVRTPAPAYERERDHARIRIVREGTWRLTVLAASPAAEAACMEGYVDGREARLGDVRILQLHTLDASPQRQGLGRILMHEIAELAVAAGIQKIAIDLPSPEGVDFYRSLNAANTPEYAENLRRARLMAPDILRARAQDERQAAQAAADGGQAPAPQAEPSAAEVEAAALRLAGPVGLVIEGAALANLAARGPMGAWIRR